ncbi:MAG: TonB-dependent receptor [Verrucomicrobiales bacterium]|nr:TonB-dependent receptor [Verrucomicrobiales bacterium]
MKRLVALGLIPAASLTSSALLAQETATPPAATPSPEDTVAAAGNPAGDPPLERMDRVVVTGTNTERWLSESPVRTEVITITPRGVEAAPKLAETLEWTTGLRVESTCQNCNSTEVQMLGLPQRYTALLTDGLPSFSSLSSVYGLEQIPTAFLDRIEVVKGGGSALYGPSAVAGVINLIPRNPTRSGGGVEFGYNWMDGHSSGDRPNLDGTVHGTVAARDGRLGVRAFGANSFVQGLDVDDDGFTEVSRRDLWSGGLRGLWQPRPEMTLTLDYLGSHEDRRGGSAGDALDAAPNTVEVAETTETRQHLGTAVFRHVLSDRFIYRLGFFGGDVARDSYYGGTAALGSPDPGSPYYDPTWTPERGFGNTDNLLVVAQGLGDWYASPEHVLTAGVQWRSEDLADYQPTVNRTEAQRFEDLGLLVQSDATLGDQFSLVSSARVDFHSELDDPEFSARLGGKYAPTDRFRLRASVGNGFRAPEVFSEDFHITNIGGALQAIENAPDLTAERSLTTTLGPEWQLSERWTVEVNGFYTWLRDTFVVESADDPATPDALEFERRNGGRSRVYGGEFNLNYATPTVQGSLGYVEQRLEYEDPQLLLGDPLWPANPDPAADPNDNPIYSTTYPRVPERYGVVRVAWDFGLATLSAAGADRSHGSPHVVTDPTGTLVRNELNASPWFFTVDLALTRDWSFRGGQVFRLSVGVRNLFNEYQEDLDQGPYRDSTYVYGPRFPRTLFASAGYEF